MVKVLQEIKKKKGNTILIMLLLILVTTFTLLFVQTERGHVQSDSNENNAFEVLGPTTMNVTLQYLYMDGEVIEEQTEETIWAMEDFWAQYEEWNLLTQSEERMVFQKEIDDISPDLKMNGYFGITEDGILSIFEGVPQDEQVIQSFFQVDTKKLKSKQHSELAKGIPVGDKDHYEEVLEVFAEYKEAEF
ncbi:BofC C-terminal domain-containing protein [Alkalihalophilus lindianensis]|uniref:BofC C-terminal domain-containing protein n=1 Tax=Alkalihalophilus lindianensis TaxID=1630542 RepID=A0ABU3XDF0_9BACI|nr:BofC C-terminal domain-containing protein [Alkalihalophilus lindianensis]MDV2685902.1 BofC C-terminal domain-containing protein [Alkalihalophilus lindianensis]